MRIPRLFNVNISIDWIFLISGLIFYLYGYSWLSGFCVGGAFFYGLKGQLLRLKEVYKYKS